MSWTDEIEELRRREELARQMGGAEKVARQHQFGKLTVRERIARLVDAGTFHEIGMLAGVGEYDEDGNLREFRPSNFVFGTAAVDGRPVVRLRRRLHGARRLGRRVDPGQAGQGARDSRSSSSCRTCAWSTAWAAAARSRPSRRRGAPTSPRCAAGRSWSSTSRWRPRCRSRWDRWPASAPRASPPATTR